jgi:sugar lactone lactonase YvrE
MQKMSKTPRTLLRVLLGMLLLSALVLGGFAAPPAVQAQAFPKLIPLPNGFQPEGIVSGTGTDFYVGSLANGAIYKGDLRTGSGALLVAGQPGRIAAGLAFDPRSGYLFASGATTGSATVYDTRTGAPVAALQLVAPGSGFVNDVIVTRQAAYFTDSFNARLYVVPLGPGGEVQGTFTVLPLSGDWVQVPGAFVFNANGIEATPNGDALIVINSSRGEIYRVDPLTGAAVRIDLGGASLSAGDGLLLEGKTLYVMRNRLNQIAVVRLANDLTRGEVTGVITDPAFRVPTTITAHGNSIYAVNARFGTPPGPNVDYDVVQVSK